MTLTFKWPLRICALLLLSIGCAQNYFTPPKSEKVFGTQKSVETIRGEVKRYSTPRGVPRLMISLNDGGIIFFDCLIHPSLCNTTRNATDKVEADVMKISGQFYWPRHAIFSSGVTVTKQNSQMLYEIYQQRESGLSKVWFAMAAAFLIFSIWFRNRPIF